MGPFTLIELRIGNGGAQADTQPGQQTMKNPVYSASLGAADLLATRKALLRDAWTWF